MFDMKKTAISAASVLLLLSPVACERDDVRQEEFPGPKEFVTPEAMAGLLSALPISMDQIWEVHDAVGISSVNGYDDEYMMTDLLTNPGGGVGGELPGKGGQPCTKSYTRPLRDLLREELESRLATKSSPDGISDVDAVLEAIGDSDLQIYWPYGEEWDERTLPTITYDPEDGSDRNVGWRISPDPDGGRHLEEVVVDEDYALNNPVWVVNRNDDSGYTTLEMLRRDNPDWGSGGGTIIVRPQNAAVSTKAVEAGQSLILHNFKALRNFDSWFAGASEFWIKVGAVEDFVASTEAELKLYNPTVTDFMVIVKRNEVGIDKPLDVMLVSDWKEQLVSCALMITEDDGGTRTSWNCSAKVMIQSKSYGLDISLPLKTSDDIVWRGQLAYKYLTSTALLPGRYGDVELTFNLISY